MVAPHGSVEIRHFYGDPTAFEREDGTISPLWDRRMVAVEFPAPLPLGWGDHQTATRARVNEIVAHIVERLFRLWNEAGLWEKLTTYDGGYCWRAQRGSAKLSMHAYGGALDFNSATNPLGKRGTIDRRLVAIAESEGWTWGGRWSRPDPMHFQWATGY